MIRKVISQLFKTNYKSKANNVRLNKFSYVKILNFLEITMLIVFVELEYHSW